jgi:hypothetical protein
MYSPMRHSKTNQRWLTTWLLAWGMLGACAVAQPAGEATSVTLRVGRFFTEEQGAAYQERKLEDYKTREDWEANAAHLREAIRQGLALDPLPKRTPLEPIARERRVHDGYSAENVAFQSVPGYWVTATLYRPTGIEPPYPAVLCPYGHYPGGRLHKDIQRRCAGLARMGAVALTYDMYGWGESPVGSKAHRTPMAQTMNAWDGMRAIDFVTSLEGVDPERIGVTGSSGGGTQTFLLTALDERVKVSVPVAMVSSFFFGGCPCESGRPIHKGSDHDTNNVEIAALAAPRPLLLVSDGGDWTHNTPEVEYPFIKAIYTLMGAPEMVENAHFPEGKHNYDFDKRSAMYPFMAKHLGLRLSAIQDEAGKITEAWFTEEPDAAMMVFDDAHPLPEGSLTDPAAVEAAVEAAQK